MRSQTKTAYRAYARSSARLAEATQIFEEAEAKYIDALLDEKGLEIGSLVSPKDGSFSLRIDTVVADEKGLFSVKGPVLKKDGTVSEGRMRILMVRDTGMVPHAGS